MLTFKNGESNQMFFNFETGKHESMYSIQKVVGGYECINNKTNEIEASAKTQKDIKIIMEDKYSEKYQPTDEIEEGFAAGGGWSGAVWITSDRNGGAWHKDKDGNIIDD